MKVIGSANASILPSPSLTFTDVQVGEADAPLMTVERFEVTIELLPLIQGEIRVTSMRLEEPSVRLSVDDQGTFDWLDRGVTAGSLDPDKIVLTAVEIKDGKIAYSDPRTGVDLSFAGINATVEARSLAGPWRVDGSYREGDAAVPFHLATGRWLPDNTIRLKADFTPAQLPFDVSADGVLGQDPAWGLTYAGTYSVSELIENTTGEATRDATAPPPAGWRSEGAFSLNQDRLSIDKAVLSHGPVDLPASVAGALTVDFGKAAAFRASVEARQLDLDRILGGGPNNPVQVSAAAERLIGQVASLPIPAIPGRIVLNVPGVVVGGAVIQDVAFTASSAANGWRIEKLSARLPGQATLEAAGMVSTGRDVSFKGNAHIGVVQPGSFAAWWRGAAGQRGGQPLPAFDISGDLDLGDRRVAISNVDARIGDSSISGRFSWKGAGKDDRSEIGTDLKADRIDFAQVVALAELVAGRDLEAATLADRYTVVLAADSFAYDDIQLDNVSIDAAYADDVLNVTQFSVGNLGGSTFKVTGGKIEGILGAGDLRGQLDARLEVNSIDGLAVLADKLFPESGALEWLGRTAPVITPAIMNARIVGAPEGNGTGFRITVADGVAGATTFSLEASSAGRISTWRDAQATLSLVLDSPDSAALARQAGFGASVVDGDTGAHLRIDAEGVPAQGLATRASADIAGSALSAEGTFTVPPGALPDFAGAFRLATEDVGNLAVMAGLGPAFSGPLAVDGDVAVRSGEVAVNWRNGQFGDRRASADLKLTRPVASGWRIDGNVSADAVDLGWLMTLGVGEAVLPTGNPAAPWSKEPFTAVAYGGIVGKVGVTAERLAVAGDMSVTGAQLAIALQPQRIDVDVTSGDIAGGKASGGFSLHNVEGNASATGQFNLAGAALDALIWRREERPVATGTVDLSTNFETTGTNPAGMIASLTGGGAITVRNGEARYVNPNAGRSIVRASDLGQEYTEDALKIVIGEQIDADSLRVNEAGAAFQIAAGTLRMSGLQVRQDGVEAAGSATLDLNTLGLESDWTLTFDPGDDKVQGTDPKIGLLFRGPVTSPSRTIDALQFASYLNTRREARMLEIIAAEEADQFEKDRLSRLKVKLQQDRERTERLAREAIEAETRRVELAAAVSARIAALHIAREMAADARAEAALARGAEMAATASESAANAASAAAAIAEEAKQRADTLDAEGMAAVTADEATRLRATVAADVLASAEAELMAARKAAEDARSLADSTNAVMFRLLDDAAQARDGASEAEAARAQASGALLSATARGQRAAQELAAAEAAQTAAVAGIKQADIRLAAARRAADEAAERFATLDAEMARARAAAEAAAAAKADKEQEEREAGALRARDQNAYIRDQKLADAAVTAAERARRDASDAQAAYEALTRTLTATTSPDGTRIEVAADSEATNAASDRLQTARAERDRLENELATAQEKANASAESLAGSRQRSDAATAAAATAADESTGLQATLSSLQVQRDAANADAERLQLAAGQAGADFIAAQEAAQSASDAVRQARAQAADARAEEKRAAAAAKAAGATAEQVVARSRDVTREQELAVEEARAAQDALEMVTARVTAAESALGRAQAESAAASAAAAATLAARQAAEEAATRARAAAAKAGADAEATANVARLRAEDAAAAQRRASGNPGVVPASLVDPEVAPDSGVDRVYTNVPLPRVREQRRPMQLAPESLVIDEPMLLLPQ